MAIAQEIHPLIKQELLDIYQSFANVCEKNGLKYWAAFGTILGAVRHKGFIPWDDDLDVMMLREDYDKFISVCSRDLPKCYKLVSIDNCRSYNGTFIKIQESRKDVYQKIKEVAGYVNPHGLYIDIFPLDGVPGNIFSIAADYTRCAAAFCRTSYLWRGWGCGGIITRLFKCVGFGLDIFFKGMKTERDFAKLYIRWMKKYPAGKSKCVRIFRVAGRFQSKFRFYVQKALLLDTSVVPFENVDIPIPRNYDTVLRQLYGGNYMTPPPLEKRISEHSKAVDCPWLYGPDSGEQE